MVAGLSIFLALEAKKISAINRERSDPFHDFAELSEDIAHHYRNLSEKSDVAGSSLEGWIVRSALDCAEVHMQLLEQPSKVAEGFLDKVEDRLIWFIYTPCAFFKKEPSHETEQAAARLSIFGMRLLQLNRPDAAMHCAKAIGSMARTASE